MSTLRVATRSAPHLPGVYAFGEIQRLHGLPVAISWKYVGRSRNLAQRLAQHAPVREANPALQEWLRANREEMEIWYTPSDDNEAIELERQLIRALQPEYNVVRYQGGSN